MDATKGSSCYEWEEMQLQENIKEEIKIERCWIE